MDEAEARLLIKRRMLVERLAGMGEFLRGSVVLMKRRCAYQRCRKCASGVNHPTWVLTVSEKGKTRTVYLGKGRVEAARQMTREYRRLTALIDQINQVNRALLTRRGIPRKGAGDGEGRMSGP